ncbi:hypothetical protein QFZ30_000855 [Arthrobacter pascens]|uniref:hypothetical protein n=1 Tax=Arthrobacter pascens TaxID=1677 RepID=UPI00278D0D8C|nr:hypothetical protein [Arthrobacter pascens]MDQ0677473.1 hypothetical protein [Arthrobacter pascens]
MPDTNGFDLAFQHVAPMVLLWPFLLAAGLYVLLRWVISAPDGGTSRVTVSQHALWIGVIGWLASSLLPAGNAGILPAGNTSPTLATPEAILSVLAWPILGCLGVHAVGKLSYPRPRLPQRLATLEVRRIRDFLPRSLAWTVAAVFAGSALLICWAGTLPGYEAIPYDTLQDGPQGFTRQGGDGRIPGPVFAACLGTAWLVLALGTGLVLWLIARRRQLEALDADENDLLRAIAMNRLLRTVATIAAGLAAIAGNFAVRPDPAENPGSWTNAAGIAAMAVLLVMWWWAPPKLASAQAGGRGQPLPESAAATQPATRLSVSLGAALGLAPVISAVAGLFFPGGLMWGQPALLVALAAAAALAVVAAGELLMHRNHGSVDEPRTWQRQPVSPALLTAAIVTLTLLIAVEVITAAGEALSTRPTGWTTTALATGAVVILSGLPLAATRMRRSVPSAVPGLDAALRAITVHRVVRTLAACFAVQAGVLLIMANRAWPPVLGLPMTTWQSHWEPAVTVGALLVTAGVVIAVIPVRGFARTAASSPQHKASAETVK